MNMYVSHYWEYQHSQIYCLSNHKHHFEDTLESRNDDIVKMLIFEGRGEQNSNGTHYFEYLYKSW